MEARNEDDLQGYFFYIFWWGSSDMENGASPQCRLVRVKYNDGFSIYDES